MFSNYDKELYFETIKILQRDHKAQEKMKEIETRLSMTRIDEQKMENIEEGKNINDIPTQIETIRSEPISTSKCKKHEFKVKSDPDPPPSDSSDSSSSDSEHKRKKRKDKKKRRKHRKMTCQTRPREMTLMTLIHLRTVIIDVDDARIRNIEKRIQSEYAQL